MHSFLFTVQCAVLLARKQDIGFTAKTVTPSINLGDERDPPELVFCDLVFI